MRDAAPKEIEAEILKREEISKQRQAMTEFTSRPEYKETTAIRDILEHMTYDKHPLDRLRLIEWEWLRKTLGGERP
jgi:protein-arginine kinase activator protein McsA